MLAAVILAVAGLLAVGRGPGEPAPAPSATPSQRNIDAAPIAPAPGVPEAAPAGHAEVHCSVDGASKDQLWGDLFEADPPLGADATRRLGVVVDGGWLVFRPTYAENIGILSIRGHRDAKLAWLDGACTAPILLERAPFTTLDLQVRLPEHLRGASVSARVSRLGNPEEWREAALVDGRVELREQPGDCVLSVFVSVDVPSGEAYGTVYQEEIVVPEVAAHPIAVDLADLPPLGWVDVEIDDQGRVVRAADDVDLRPGDALVRAGGLRHGRGLGPADQPVSLTVAADEGTERTVVVPRTPVR